MLQLDQQFAERGLRHSSAVKFTIEESARIHFEPHPLDGDQMCVPTSFVPT